MTTSIKDWQVILILLVEKQRLSKFFEATQQVSAWIYNSQVCLLLSPAGRADSLWNVYFQQTLKGQEESKRTKGTDKESINFEKYTSLSFKKMLSQLLFKLSDLTSTSA